MCRVQGPHCPCSDQLLGVRVINITSDFYDFSGGSTDVMMLEDFPSEAKKSITSTDTVQSATMATKTRQLSVYQTATTTEVTSSKSPIRAKFSTKTYICPLRCDAT